MKLSFTYFFKKSFGHLTIILCLLNTARLFAQDCDSNYSSFVYNASDFLTYSKALTTPDNSVLCLQTNRLYSHGITKFTPHGNVIFSYEYTAPFVANSYHSWTDLIFSDLAVSNDGTAYITGSVTKHGVFYDNTETPPARTAATVSKIDKYGVVIWSRFFANSTTAPLAFSNVIVLNNGDIVCYLTTQVVLPYYSRVICLSPDGTVKWTVTLNTGDYSSGRLVPANKIAMLQIKKGDVIISDIVSHYYPNLPTSNEFHFIALNPSTGAIDWETSYDYNQSDFIPNIIYISELPNQSLSFQTTWNNPLSNGNGLLEHLNIITDNKGSIIKMIATHPTNDFITPVDAKSDNLQGDQTALLFAGDGNTVLMKINEDGKLLWSRKYGKLDNQVPPTCYAKINNWYDISLSNFSRSFRMLITDPIGRLDCDTLSVNLEQEEMPPFTTNINNITTIDSPAANEIPYYTGFFVVQNTITTFIKRDLVCQKSIPCCTDIVDTVNINTISLCEGSTYKLPDQTIIKDSGIYYSLFKISKGCDSVSLYKVNIYKNTISLALGPDTCFNNNDSLMLHATDGYNGYSWMRSGQTLSSHYTAYHPGVYYVTVSNICGNKTDSIHVYKQCDFPIYMPNAFTPNNDQLNDTFKVPLLNTNRFIKLTIYNRWGKIVFQTTTISKGWDGNINGIQQDRGVYIYYLEMENLIGKKLIQKGLLTLLR